MLVARARLVPDLPLMYPKLYIRPARVEEAAALSDLCFRSKAVWGYDAEFMAPMPAALRVAPEEIAAGDVWIATGTDGRLAGVVALAPGDAPGTLDLNKLFIEPRHMRGGVGRALLAHVVAEAQRRHAERLTILADPNAAGFYERNGAARIDEAPSDTVPAACCRSTSQARSHGVTVTSGLTSPQGVKCRPARDSLIRRIISLMARFNSLLGRFKFPVPMCRELHHNGLIFRLDSGPFTAVGGSTHRNSLYFPS